MKKWFAARARQLADWMDPPPVPPTKPASVWRVPVEYASWMSQSTWRAILESKVASRRLKRLLRQQRKTMRKTR